MLAVIYPCKHNTAAFASTPESYLAATAIAYFAGPIPDPLSLMSSKDASCSHNLEYPSDVRLRYIPMRKLLS